MYVGVIKIQSRKVCQMKCSPFLTRFVLNLKSIGTIHFQDECNLQMLIGKVNILHF